MENSQNHKNSLYVITGAPGCGKTTLCGELYSQGYLVLPETARRLIRENEINGGVLPWTDFENFQRQVMSRQKALETIARDVFDKVFADRALPDTLGYFYARKAFDVPLDMKLEIHRQKYDGVFLLEPLVHYSKDAQRKESRAEMLGIHSALYAAYSEIGHVPVIVPAVPVIDRVEFIFERIKEKDKLKSHGGKNDTIYT